MGSSWSKSKLCKFSCYTVALGGILMYYLLSLLPILLQIFINICVSPNYNFALFVIHFVWILFGLPIYLLFVNLHYCKIKKIKYLISYINMPLILILIIGVGLIFHKINYGKFLGDVPIIIYLMEFIIPILIILIGISIHKTLFKSS